MAGVHRDAGHKRGEKARKRNAYRNTVVACGAVLGTCEEGVGDMTRDIARRQGLWLRGFDNVAMFAPGCSKSQPGPERRYSIACV